MAMLQMNVSKGGWVMNVRRWMLMDRKAGICMTAAVFLALIAVGCAHTPSPVQPGAAAAPETAPIVRPMTGAASDYSIGAGDVLEISVWKDQTLTRQVVVLPDGTITFPLVGRFQAAGKTVDALKSEMETKLVRFIPEPELSLIVQQVNSQVVYVIGKVNRPGHIPLNRNIDVLQALAMAGGLNVFADQQDIRIFRKTADATMVIPFDYKAVTEGNQLEGNIMLQRGDVVVVR
jgi:polysaccharide biosynthesis/export protein